MKMLSITRFYMPCSINYNRLYIIKQFEKLDFILEQEYNIHIRYNGRVHYEYSTIRNQTNRNTNFR